MSDLAQEIHTALVLAAGRGRRLRPNGPKPIFPLLGLPLLARTLFTLQEAGITDAYVVLGYAGDRIRRAIERIDGLSIRVHWLYNDRWTEPNGLSVLAAAEEISEPFILTMSDHLFEAAAVDALRKSARSLRGVDLVVDYDVDQVNDLDDATRVRVESGRIVEIGKSISDYNAIDTGVFLASPALFEALRETAREGRASLSDGVQRLAEKGAARAIDGTGLTWQDIDTSEDVAEAERKLLESVRKDTDGPIARYINRPISAILSRQLVKMPITPNQVSIATLVVGVVSAGLAAARGYLPGLLAGLLFQAASILDGADGEVAKLTFRTSLKGQWVDTICDSISYVAFLVGLTVGAYRSRLPEFYVWMGALATVTALISLTKIQLILLTRGDSGSAVSIRYGYENGTSPLSRLMRWAHWLGKRDMFAFLTLQLGVLGRLHLALPLFGILGSLLLLPTVARVDLPALWRSESLPASRPEAEG